MKIIEIKIIILLTLMLALNSCGGGSSDPEPQENNDSSSVAARTQPIAPGNANCPNGGVLVQTGIDENNNGILDDNEVDESESLCHGDSGLNALVESIIEAPGTNCVSGGIEISFGLIRIQMVLLALAR